jgi:hypothetical protein
VVSAIGIAMAVNVVFYGVSPVMSLTETIRPRRGSVVRLPHTVYSPTNSMHEHVRLGS